MNLVQGISKKIWAGRLGQDFGWPASGVLEHRYDFLTETLRASSSIGEGIARISYDLLQYDGADRVGHTEGIEAMVHDLFLD